MISISPVTHFRTTPTVFILWGEQFEEVVATIFATELRRAGLAVKLVGVTGPRAAGYHGIILAADVTLGDALGLAATTSAIIIPCHTSILQRVEDDPRLRDFFQQAVAHEARLIVSRAEVITRSSLQHLAIAPEQVLFYPAAIDLVAFAQSLAHSLEAVANL